MKIIFECELAAWWATPEQWAEMTDAQVEDLVREDITAALDGATVRIVRNTFEIAAGYEAMYADRAKETT